MPKLFDTLKEHQLVLRKNHEKEAAALLSVVIAESSKNTKEPSDEEVIAVLRKMIKSAEDMRLKYYSTSAHQEIELLNKYLPEEATVDEYIDALQVWVPDANFITMKNIKAIKELISPEISPVNMSTLAQAIKEFNE